ncbi:MAG: diguanylate cyclase [Candidatus Accumulibacter sp.]|nr:diguanylate cyclase [Accumulibacter sp.]
MPNFSNPSEIARETLRQLAIKRLSPSPENYRAIYHEIAGTTTEAGETFPEREFAALLAALPKQSAAQLRIVKRFESALKAKNWQDCQAGLNGLVNQWGQEQETPWGELFGEFLRQWESKQPGLTIARKRDAFDHVLTGSASNESLFSRLQGLIKSWAQNVAASDDIPLTDGKAPPVDSTAVPASTDTGPEAVPVNAEEKRLAGELRDLFGYTLETLIAGSFTDEPEIAGDSRRLAHQARTATSRASVDGLQNGLKRLAFRLELLTEDRAELRNNLLNLLRLLIANVGELVSDDHWLQGQIAIVSDIVAAPLSLRSLGDAETRLKEVIFKQSQLKQNLTDAKESLKHMLAEFVDHLAEFADSTSEYHDKIEVCAEKINQAENIAELKDVLDEVIRETQQIQRNTQRSRDDLQAAKRRVDEAEKRIDELQSELDKASLLVRHDQLTGALNRRGLEEAMDKEVARSRRRRAVLCVAMLDIDNFKKLNDSLGHDAGDAALIHLATVIRESMRPHDTVARFGGEEFILLLPDTTLDDAQTALTRLQRELTRRIFMHNNNRQLITFSAGVTDFRADDSQTSVTKRADEAMYAAKQAGKNRVCVA